jgi:hypothetical protein
MRDSSTPRQPRPVGQRLAAAARWLLLLRVVPTRDGFVRPVDLVILSAVLLVGFVVVVPILVATIAIAYAVGFLLHGLGAPDVIFGLVILVFGFGGACVLSFVALLRISRRLPAAIRAIVYEEDDAPEPAPISRRDPDADRSTLVDRLGRADAALAPADESQPRDAR